MFLLFFFIIIFFHVQLSSGMDEKQITSELERKSTQELENLVKTAELFPSLVISTVVSIVGREKARHRHTNRSPWKHVSAESNTNGGRHTRYLAEYHLPPEGCCFATYVVMGETLDKIESRRDG